MPAHSARIGVRYNVNEDRNMGCCGSCGGEAPNHTNEQDKKDKEKEATSQPQETDKDKK